VTINPHAATVHQDSLTWAQRFQLIPDAAAARRLAASNIGGLAARFHPHAARDALHLVAAWYVWGFVRDDLCDESDLGKHPAGMMELNARCLEILQGACPTPTDHRLTHA
jgi:hypothetical protein